jgi:hypothetical protein
MVTVNLRFDTGRQARLSAFDHPDPTWYILMTIEANHEHREAIERHDMSKHDPGQLAEQSRIFFIMALLSFYAAALRQESKQPPAHALELPVALVIPVIALVGYGFLCRKVADTRQRITMGSVLAITVGMIFIADRWPAPWGLLVFVGALLFLMTAHHTLLPFLCMVKRGFEASHSGLVERSVQFGAWFSVYLAPFALTIETFLILNDIRTRHANSNEAATSIDQALPSWPDWLTFAMLITGLTFVILNFIVGLWALKHSHSELTDTGHLGTSGFSNLTLEDQSEIEGTLSMAGHPWRRHHKEDQKELIITKVKPTVLIPDIASYLSRFHVSVTDYQIN